MQREAAGKRTSALRLCFLMSFKPLSRASTLVEQVHERLLEAICNGDLPPGERLIQDALATRLQVSRQPVTAALALLRQQGFAVEHGKRGLQVAPVDRARLASIAQLRLAIEPLAARLAAERATLVDVDYAKMLIARERKAICTGNRPAILRADLDFHQWLCTASGNPLLEQSMRLHWLHLRRAPTGAVYFDALADDAPDEHLLIVEAIASGDMKAASRLAQDHLVATSARSEASPEEMTIR